MDLVVVHQFEFGGKTFAAGACLHDPIASQVAAKPSLRLRCVAPHDMPCAHNALAPSAAPAASAPAAAPVQKEG